MKIIINNENTNNKDLYYEEGFWTGKRTVKYDGAILPKVKRGSYEYKNGEITEIFKIKGNQLAGIKIKMFGSEVEIVRKITWQEIIMSILVFLPGFLFGAIGGAIGGLLGFTNLVIIRQVDKIYLKIIFSILFMAIGLLLSYILAVLVFKIVFTYF